MKIKLKIQQKIQVFIISASILIYVIAIGYISYNARNMAFNDMTLYTNSIVQENAKDISEQLNIDMSIVKTLSYAYRIYDSMTEEQWKRYFLDMNNEVLLENQDIFTIWDSWELKVIDPTWTKSHGRYASTITREKNGEIIFRTGLRSIEAESRIYDKIIKKRRVPSIWEPYFDTFGITESYLMTTLNSPIIKDGQYIGIVAIDITLDKLQEIVKKINPFEGSYAFMISHEGIVAGHPEEDVINQKLVDVFPEDFDSENIGERIKRGESFDYTSKDQNGVETYYAYAPIIINGTNTPWAIAISVPIDIIMAKAIKNFRISIIVGVIGILLLAIVISLISKNITDPITKITQLLKQLAKGRIDEEMRIKITTGDEIEEMSLALDNSIEGLNKKVDFANHIEKGDLNYNFDLLSEEDVLGESLIDMRKSLLKAKEEEEKRKIEDEKRRWANEGLAKFADILRQNNDNIENLGSEIIMNLVNYLGANQGGLFIMNDDNPDKVHLSLLSAFAYDRKKYMEKQIQIGEGLIGTSAIEKKTIFMTDIPQDYIEITSGLGGANPSCLLIAPLKLEDNILGAIEIASFKVLEKHEIEFVEKLAESIAATLSSVRINIKTNELLEKSQQQAEEMATQDEEMRQNLEELQSTQEEMHRKEEHLKSIIEEMKTQETNLKKTIEKYKNKS